MTTVKAVLSLFLSGLALAHAAQNEWRFPEPPRQHAAWKADERIPTNLLSAATALFDQGFPDPRGCEFSEIEVKVSGLWGGTNPLVKTSGWVLPVRRARDTNRFAICWNGLIYPATVLAPADLQHELTNPAAPPRFGGGDSAAGEPQTVKFSGSLSTRALLLLRAGETDAALTRWQTGRQRMGFNGRSGSEGGDPYLEFAGDWAWALFDRTISAHMRGDEALALATALTLADAQPKIEAEAAKRGFKRAQYYDSGRQGKEKPYLDFAEQLPALLADLERRVREGQRLGALERGLTNFPQPAARIAALIRDLEFVQARQWGQPGGVNPGDDPIVQALITEGDAAVEPLLDCLEQDKRLTRSVGFWRDFSRNRTVIPVTSAARTALQAILHANFGSVAEMRAYWNRFKSMKLEDRWYVMLQDDSASMGRWLEAAGNITQPENVRTFPGSGFSESRPVPTNAPARLRGDILRSKSNPSVAELMARRALEISETNPAAYDISSACQMGLQLVAWEPRSAASVVKSLSARLRAQLEYSRPPTDWQGQIFGTLMPKLALARVQAGDTNAFGDYSAWLQQRTPEHLGSYLKESVEPLARFPSNEVLRAAADGLFDNTNGPWGKLPWKGDSLHNPVESGLAQVPAFRRLLVRELDRDEICGRVEWRGAGGVSYSISNLVSGSRGFAWPGTNAPVAGLKTDLRWCDWIAWSLSNGKHPTSFNPFAAVEERDAAITQAKNSLEGTGAPSKE